MLPGVRLARAGIVTSRLAFGTSRLHYLGRAEQHRLLAAAAELGFVHFDTAPAYGDGLAEAVLGRFVARGRDRFIVSTKYGVPADPIIQRWGSMGPMLRITRAVARKAGFWQPRLPPLTPAGLRESAETSLRRLKTDRIDIFLLHEPNMERLSSPGAILAELSDLKQRGLIRAFGVAGSWSCIEPLLKAEPGLGEVVQTAESEWPDGLPPEITYSAISRTSQSYFAAGSTTDLATRRLRAALLKRPNGVVIVSSTKTHHLRALAEVAREQRM